MNAVVAELTALTDADHRDFHRRAVASVFNEYVAFMATGAYPYNDEVVTRIALAYRVGEHAWGPRQRFHHQAVADLGEPLLRKLHREVYLASGEWKVAEMRATEASLALDGYRPITEFVPTDGAKIMLHDKPVPLRCKPANRGDWALLPPRARTNGISLNALVAAHNAYEAAVTEGQTRMNGPRVVMFKACK